MKHNVEVAHRIHNLPGKCTNIHGHSMWITLKLVGGLHEGFVTDPTGRTLEFSNIKREFRRLLDDSLDHRLLLNKEDPILEALKNSGILVTTFDGPPSTENIARYVFHEIKWFELPVHSVEVQETHVNGVEYSGE